MRRFGIVANIIEVSWRAVFEGERGVLAMVLFCTAFLFLFEESTEGESTKVAWYDDKANPETPKPQGVV